MGREEDRTRASTLGNSREPWQTQHGGTYHVGLGAPCTSVPTHTWQKLQLFFWSSLPDLAFSFALHCSGYTKGTIHSFRGEKSMGYYRCYCSHFWKYYLPQNLKAK